MWSNRKVFTMFLCSSAVLSKMVVRAESAVQIQIRGGAPNDQAHCVEDEKQEILRSVSRILAQQSASRGFHDRAQYCSQVCLPTGTPGQLCTEIEKVCNETPSQRRGLKGSHRKAWDAPFFLFGDEGNESPAGNDDFTLDGFGGPDDDVASFFSMFDDEGDGSSSAAGDTDTFPASATEASTSSPTASPTKSRCDFTALSQKIDLSLSHLLSPACKRFLDIKFHFECFDESSE